MFSSSWRWKWTRRSEKVFIKKPTGQSWYSREYHIPDFTNTIVRDRYIAWIDQNDITWKTWDKQDSWQGSNKWVPGNDLTSHCTPPFADSVLTESGKFHVQVVFTKVLVPRVPCRHSSGVGKPVDRADLFQQQQRRRQASWAEPKRLGKREVTVMKSLESMRNLTPIKWPRAGGDRHSSSNKMLGTALAS